MSPSLPTRRGFLASGAALLGPALAGAPAFAQRKPQRLVVLMVDGFGLDYMEKSRMPNLAKWRASGIFRRGQDVMPSVTNTNNASICCGVWPDRHGITGNSYFDERTGREEYMETADLLMAPTIFERARKHGVRSALMTSKKKTAGLLSAGAETIVAAEAPGPDWVRRFGKAPDIYSREINYWLMTAAVDLLKTRPEIGCLYIHTTDYPMHTWAPEERESQEHLARLDELLGAAAAAAPDAAFALSADHGMNHKTHCRDLEKICASRGAPVRISVSVDRDKYVKHHRGYGGVSWIYLKSPADADRVARILTETPGVESVLTRSEAAARFRTMPSRIGDLAVLGDRDTVFGDLDAEVEELPKEYRAHGSAHEVDIPLAVYNAEAKLRPEDFRFNVDLAKWAYAS